MLYGIKDKTTNEWLLNVFGNPITFEREKDLDIWIDSFGAELYMEYGNNLETVEVKVVEKED